MCKKSVSIEVITPDIAKEYLKCNKFNRRVSRPTVNKYKTELLNGNFEYNGESIIFCEDGSLFDGQHRLLACVETGIPFESVVSRGVNQDRLHTIDSGKSRNASDSFYMHNIKNATNMAALASKYFLFKNNIIGFSSADGKSTTIKHKSLRQQMLDDYFKNEELYNSILEFATQCYGKYRLLTPSEIGGLFMWLVRDKSYNYDFVKTFFENLFLIDNDVIHPILLLKIRLIQNMSSSRKITARVKSSLIAKTWNAYVEGKDFKVLKWAEEEGDVEFK